MSSSTALLRLFNEGDGVAALPQKAVRSSLSFQGSHLGWVTLVATVRI